MLTLQDQPTANHLWQKGKSGNPRGRPRQGWTGPSVAELARTYTPDAIKALVIALHHPSSRVAAAVALLDRGWGKPEQLVHTTNETTVLHLIAAQATATIEAAKPDQTPTIEADPTE